MANVKLGIAAQTLHRSVPWRGIFMAHLVAEKDDQVTAN